MRSNPVLSFHLFRLMLPGQQRYWGFKSPSPHHDLKKLKGHRATDGLYLFGHVSGLKSSRIYVGRLQMHECMRIR